MLGMGNTAACAHDLHIAGLGAAFMPHAVLVGDGARAYIGDDLHIVMRVGAEALLCSDAVIIDDAQRAELDAVRVPVAREAEVVAGIQPAVIGVS